MGCRGETLAWGRSPHTPFYNPFRIAILLFQQGKKLAEKEEFDAAIASYEKVLNINPNYHEAWKQKGESLQLLKHFEDAIHSYNKAMAIKADESWAWRRRGDALAKLGCYDEAIGSYNKAVELSLIIIGLRKEKAIFLVS